MRINNKPLKNVLKDWKCHNEQSRRVILLQFVIFRHPLTDGDESG